MKRKYHIGIYFCMVCMCVLYWASYRFAANAPVIPAPETEQSTEEIPVKSVIQSTDAKVYSYYLVEEDGHVYVYLNDKVTLYETTTIQVSSLPDDLQREISQGKFLLDDHELYNFLENYSS